MAHVIAEPCIGTKNTACVAVCPTDAIHPRPDESDFPALDQLFIDPSSCIDCAQCVAVCPVNAIFQQNDLPPEWASYIEKNADYYE